MSELNEHFCIKIKSLLRINNVNHIFTIRTCNERSVFSKSGRSNIAPFAVVVVVVLVVRSVESDDDDDDDVVVLVVSFGPGCSA